MKAEVRWKTRSYPYQRPGLGIGLLGFCVWILVVLLQACWFVAKWIVVGAVVVVAAIMGWIESRRASP